MSDNTIARRYATALYEEAQSASNIEAVDSDVSMIQESLNGAPELGRFFESPIISREKKSATVTALFEGRLEKLTLRFLLLMIEKGREQMFAHVLTAYESLRDEQNGIVQILARVARPVDDSEIDSLASHIEASLNKKVRLEVQVDPSLLGGIVVKIGDTVHDGSFVNQLKTLRTRLEQGVSIAS